MILRTAIATLFLVAAGLAPARAQSGEDGAALLSAGAEAIEAGRHQDASRQLSRAMRSEDLSPKQIARALFLRGVAQRNAGRPAQAIADLTGALWLEGLSEQERARAYLNRGRAYQAVGSNDRAKADLRRAGADTGADTTEETGEVPAAASNRQAEPARTAASDGGAGRVASHANPAPGSSPPPPTRRSETAAAASRGNDAGDAENAPAVPSFRTSIQPGESAGEAPEEPGNAESRETPRRSPAPDQLTRSAANEPEESPGALSGFFGGLWESATGSDEEEAAGNAENGRAPLTNQWTRTTKVDRTSAAAAASATSSSGNTIYHVQLAAVRSESDAQATWEKLATEHETLLSGRDPVIRKSETGASGTIYRVQVGPFSDKKESARLCNAFKNEGVDCFLVAR